MTPQSFTLAAFSFVFIGKSDVAAHHGCDTGRDPDRGRQAGPPNINATPFA